MIHVAHLREHVVSGRRLGRHVEHDPESRMFAHAETSTAGLKSASWTRHGDPFDQGELGSCTCNAIAGACMTEPLFQPLRVLTEVDAVALYRLATMLDDIEGSYPPDDTGSSGLAACKAAKRRGLIGSYSHAFTLSAMLSALQHGPVIVGMNWYASFETPDADGLVSIAKHSPIRGGHEVECFGVDIVRDSHGEIAMTLSKLHFWNSWGTSYGVGGAFSMTLATWQRLMSEGGDCTVPHR